jgi:hypothetical protein
MRRHEGMNMLTPKENYLMCLRGEQPEWVPWYTMGAFPGWKWELPSQIFEPPILGEHRMRGGGKDLWGVNYVATDSAEMALIPDHNFILPLDDLPRWRDIIKAPDFSDVDWEQEVKKHFDLIPIDRKNTGVAFALHFGYFQHLASFMGFSDAMIAMAEEPDLVKELLNYLSDFYISVVDKTIDRYNPDTLCLMDDTASWNAPFISVAMYEEFVLPHHAKFTKYGIERGLPMTMHNCGKAESFLDLLISIGITAWDPAQTSNDLVGIKQKYGNSLVLMGGWDGREHLDKPLQSPEHPDGVTEEEIRQSVRDSIDALAAGGGYCWLGNFLTAVGDTENPKKNEILNDEAESYCKTWYQTH